jgi:hypothetical protein
VLSENQITLQPYHGGTVIGTHALRILRCGPALASVLDPDYDAVQHFQTLFRKLLDALLISSLPRPLCRHELSILAMRCASLGNYYPSRFPTAPLPPKLHVLCVDVPRFARAHGTVGSACEQSVESSNRIFNRLDSTFRTIKHSMARLRATVEQYVVESSPKVKTITAHKRVCPRCSLPLRKSEVWHCKCQKKRARDQASSDSDIEQSSSPFLSLALTSADPSPPAADSSRAMDINDNVLPSKRQRV